MFFYRRIFTALLCTSVVLPLTGALATDLRSTSWNDDLFSALRGVDQDRLPGDAAAEPTARPDLPSEDGHPFPKQAVVRFGDTIDSIAQRHGLSVDQLMRLNPELERLPLVVGRQLRVQSISPRVHQLISLKPATSGGVSWPDTPDYSPTTPGSSAAKRWLWPARGVFTSGYGWRWGRMHKGIDIANSTGTPIIAVQNGRVTFAGWSDGGYGYLVEISHEDGSRSLYAHQSRILVQEGEEVRQGQQIGLMGSTGRSTGPHLHFEIHSPGYGAINPLERLQPSA
jgi:murein DD-endopeptidase MepM/ murein hydrolase activator NlpD